MRSSRTASVLVGAALVLSGCGGCQEEANPPAAPSTPTMAPAASGAADKAPATAAPAELDSKEDDAELIIWASGEPDAGPPPLTVTFSVESLEEEFDVPSYEWNFGDGSPLSTEASPVHTYEKSGQYTARVTVTQANGLTGQDETWVEVE